MIKKSFFGIKKQKLKYATLENIPADPVNISDTDKFILFSKVHTDKKDQFLIKSGQDITKGQGVKILKDHEDVFISPVSGRISKIDQYIGMFDKKFTTITINAENDEDKNKDNDKENPFTQASKEHSLKVIKNFLANTPGAIPKLLYQNSDVNIDTLIIYGVDNDLLLLTNQYIVKSKINDIKNGIKILKEVFKIKHIMLACPDYLAKHAYSAGCEVKALSEYYPCATPTMVAAEFLDKVVPLGKSCEDLGITSISAEAVANLGQAFEEGKQPFTKCLTLIKKDGSRLLLNAKIGTTLEHIFKTVGITVNENDRIVIGGPMTGYPVYSTNYPVLPDTDGIMIQDSKDLPHISTYPCINCGECIRICPTNVPVNMLIRFLEAGKYEDASNEYDLFSCIECGLCSYVCISKMPIFQYIKLAKYELAKAKALEESNG